MAATRKPVALLAGAATPMRRAAGAALEAAGFTIAPDGAAQCLVYAAAAAREDTALSADALSLGEHLDLNLQAPLGLVQVFARALPAGERGSIIFLSPLAPGTPKPFSARLSLGALDVMTRLLAQALAPRIRVNMIAPGPVLPAITTRPPPDAAAQIGAAVRYLLTAEAVTGETIALDI